MSASAPPPVPLLLIAGFLGSGKTTLLRELLPRLTAAGLVPQVLLNDYRNAWVDARTLEGLARAVVPISGTCICCDSSGELLDALATLTLPPRSVVLVEANGTSDTESVLELLTLDRQARRLTLPLQVGVVDAKRWQKRYWNNRLEWAQQRTATLHYLTRRGEVDDRRWREVRAALELCAPRAECTDVADLAARLTALVEGAGVLPPRRFFARYGTAAASAAAHAQHHFASLELSLPPQLAEAALRAFLRELPPGVLRVKGVAVLAGPPAEGVHFQMIEEVAEPVFLSLGAPDGLDPVMVLIGPRLPVEQIQALAACHFGAAVAE